MNNMYFPKVSIITASFNSEKYIENTIVSVINQTYPNIEYIIVDGGSKDNTLKIVYKYKNKISKIISEPDNGVYEAFNKGIRISSGDIIYFLNSDDYLDNNSIISDVVKIFLDNKFINIVYGNVKVFDELDGFNDIMGSKITINDLKIGKMCPHQGFFVKKNLFINKWNFDQRYKIASDFDFVIKCFKNDNYKPFYSNKVIAVFRLGGASSYYKNTLVLIREKRKIIKENFGIYYYIRYSLLSEVFLIKNIMKGLLIKFDVLKYYRKIKLFIKKKGYDDAKV